MSLEEPFRLGANHLKKHLADLVPVIVRRRDGGPVNPLDALTLRPETTGVQRLDYPALIATRVAMHQNLAVNVAQAKRWILVHMRGAIRQPVCARLSPVQARCDVSRGQDSPSSRSFIMMKCPAMKRAPLACGALRSFFVVFLPVNYWVGSTGNRADSLVR